MTDGFFEPESRKWCFSRVFPHKNFEHLFCRPTEDHLQRHIQDTEVKYPFDLWFSSSTVCGSSIAPAWFVPSTEDPLLEKIPLSPQLHPHAFSFDGPRNAGLGRTELRSNFVREQIRARGCIVCGRAAATRLDAVTMDRKVCFAFVVRRMCQVKRHTCASREDFLLQPHGINSPDLFLLGQVSCKHTGSRPVLLAK
ncbi:hypothetical protein VTL71DRAFT_15426 [Oculimacula yallundae]|uniref:Uncharacterized protein n=1 Tax=Oculimacula yallundae TaxID=86028 RepID=A0ABR4CGN7_9HELO